MTRQTATLVNTTSLLLKTDCRAEVVEENTAVEVVAVVPHIAPVELGTAAHGETETAGKIPASAVNTASAEATVIVEIVEEDHWRIETCE